MEYAPKTPTSGWDLPASSIHKSVWLAPSVTRLKPPPSQLSIGATTWLCHSGDPLGVVRMPYVAEPGRALGRRDVESVIGVPVVAEIPLDPAVARAVDAGLLSCRLPATIGRALKAVA